MLLIGGLVYLAPISSIVRLASANETYDHILLIPAISLFFLLLQRNTIFSKTNRHPLHGLAVMAAGCLVYAGGFLLREELSSPAFRSQDVPNDYLTLCMIGAIAWVFGSFIAVYGTQAFKKARFPLFFLAFAVPLPMFLLNPIVVALQYASAEAADVVFKLTGAAYYRNHLVFEFPNVAVQVAEVCSGIRSSLALVILSVIVGHLFLRSSWNRVILVFSIGPITVFKNALRIVTITLLANYVDLKFLTDHWIHRSGGIPFFAAAMVMFIPIVWMLRRNEAREARPRGLIAKAHKT